MRASRCGAGAFRISVSVGLQNNDVMVGRLWIGPDGLEGEAGLHEHHRVDDHHRTRRRDDDRSIDLYARLVEVAR